MRIIAFVTHSSDTRQILNHIGVKSESPHRALARGPSLWDECDSHVEEGADGEPNWDMAAQLVPEYEVDQRVNWCLFETAISAAASSSCVRSNCLGQTCSEAPNPRHTWPHAPEFPIRFYP